MMTNITIEQRVAALPAYHQSSILAFVEFLEWKNSLPSGRRDQKGDNRKIGARLLAVRKALEQSQETAASVADIALTTYAQYERGIIGRWPTRKITAYAEAWNVSLDWLVGGSGTMFVGDHRPELATAPHLEPIAPAREIKPGTPGDARPSNVVRFAPRR